MNTYAQNPPQFPARNRHPIPDRIRSPSQPPRPYNRSHMQPAPNPAFYETPSAARRLGGEKPHQGVRRKKTASHRGFARCKSRNALGLRSGCAGNRVRSFCSGEQYDPDLGLYYLRARYYNQVTGRFLNVDPLAGDGQRRYEYAGADPVDGEDPSGNFVIESYDPLHAGLTIKFPPFAFSTPPWCGGAGTGPMSGLLPTCAPPPCDRNTTNCCPQCLAELHSRPAVAWPGKHAFWYLVDATSNTYIVDAGGSNESGKPDYGWLNDWPPFNPKNPQDGLPAHGHYPADNRSAPLVWSAPSTPQLWSQIASLLFAADNWPNGTIKYNSSPGTPNSNTFAHCMGDDAGFTGVTAPPWWSPGWPYGNFTCPAH
jgi:RHS repeat-associated protein